MQSITFEDSEIQMFILRKIKLQRERSYIILQHDYGYTCNQETYGLEHCQRRLVLNQIPTNKHNKIIYHDFLPPPRRGCHVKSDNTHTIINIRPFIFSSCAIFTVYPNRIM